MSIYFYYCNLIDFFRIIFLSMSIYASGINFILLYSISAMLDYFDGKLARKYNQCTFFGACFDMFIDRISTLVVVFKIAQLKIQYSNFIFLLYLIDLISHLLFFTATNKLGTHHKKIDKDIFLRLYYHPIFLFLICCLSECSLMYIYYYGNKKNNILLILLPYILKTFFHLLHLKEALILYEKIK